jgi:hypothetical protein
MKYLVLASLLAFSPVLAVAQLSAAEHKHEHAHGDEKHALGEVTLGGVVLVVTLHGDAVPGKESEVTFVAKGAAPKGVIRGWIGSENGKGSVKGKAHSEDDGMCIHCEVPKPLPADAKVWLELDADGTKTAVSLALPKE